MTPLLRIEMILLAAFMITIVISSVNRKKMCIQYSLTWIVIALVLAIIALFPDIVFFMCELLDIQTPSNLIYLAGIIALLLVTFSQTLIISKQNEQIKFLIQHVSMDQYERSAPENETIEA